MNSTTTTKAKTIKPRNRIAWLVALLAIGITSYLQAAEPAKVSPANSDEESVVQLSPFEVVAENKGYMATNTMSGTRLNSKLEDLAASITVVTKEQMQDFAMLDINDVFNYEAGTEGTGNYTDLSFNRNGTVINNVQLNPQQANRLRGVGVANTTIGNFESSGRVPFDPLTIDAVEISRGPNAALFGIGTAGGTVNTVPAAANLSRNKNQLTFRVDSSDGNRATIDLNRVLLKDVLAIRGSAALQNDGYELKPSGVHTTRYNGMMRYRPFKKTMLSASYSSYHARGNRPNSNTPADMITGWVASGSPTFDAVLNGGQVKKNGVPVPATALPPRGITDLFSNPNLALSMAYVDQSGIAYLGAGRSTSSTDPAVAADFRRTYNTLADPTYNLYLQPLFQKYTPLTDKSIYDWSSLNLSAINRIRDSAHIASVLLDQLFLDTPRQTLALQLGWFHEDGDRWTRNPLGGDARAGGVLGVGVDINETLISGVPNPFFLRPFIEIGVPTEQINTIDRNIYRAQLAYKLDFRGDKNWLRWLGMHQVSAYGEYKHYISRYRSYGDAIVDNHAWLGTGFLRTGLGSAAPGLRAGPSIAGPSYRFQLGDKNGNNVDYAPTSFNYGTYVLNYGNPTTGFVQEPVLLGTGTANTTGGNSNQRSIQKSRGVILQSHVLKDRIVATIGERHDELFTRRGGALVYNADGINFDQNSFNSWAAGDWTLGKGPTRMAGLVVKAFPWLSVFANKSDSFVPAGAAQTLFLQKLPDPYGQGKDYGVALSLFQGKLYIRYNQYRTNLLLSRGGDAGTYALRLQRLEFSDSSARFGFPQDAFRLQTKATEWVMAAAAASGTTLTAAQIETRVADVMQLPVEYTRPFESNVSATNDILAKGQELEINYNPTHHWTVKLNVTEQKSITKNISPDIMNWIDKRMAYWQNLVDPITGTRWFTERYNNAQNAQDFLTQNVTTPLKISLAQEGKARPQIRRYRANFSNNFRLEGLTDQLILKRFNVGGALRWEDKGAIGYYGVEKAPAIVTALDGNRPVYNGSHLYVDAFVGYRAPFFSKKVTATWQLNVRNLNEGGRLQPVAANPDGSTSAYRIIDPRQFILSATFDL